MTLSCKRWIHQDIQAAYLGRIQDSVKGGSSGVHRFPERYFWAKVNFQIGIFHTNEWAKGGFDWTPQSPPGSATAYLSKFPSWSSALSWFDKVHKEQWVIHSLLLLVFYFGGVINLYWYWFTRAVFQLRTLAESLFSGNQWRSTKLWFWLARSVSSTSCWLRWTQKWIALLRTNVLTARS